jgi:uncharacterized protein (DUF1800 family)
VADPLAPWRPSAGDAWDLDAASHLFRRAGFGASPRVIRAALERDPLDVVAGLVAGPAEDPAAEELDSIQETVLGTADEDIVRAWLVSRMLRCEHQLREKLALFWHSHFATSVRKVRKLHWMMRQYRLFLDLGLGHFAPLLDAVTRDPAMIRWLDNETNTKGQPNENYARELFELFTLGEGRYSEQDIREAGRAFTGWHILNDRYHFSTAQHDGGDKRVLGRTGRFNGDDVCRIALEQDDCARFLAGKLLRFFVTPEPDDASVAALAKRLRATDYDMSAALGTLFSSRLFFAAASRRSLIKSPCEYVVGGARCLDGRLSVNEAVPLLRELGQELLAPPNVKGWPGHKRWINTATWLARANGASLIANRAGIAATPEAVGSALLGRPLPGPERDALAAAKGAYLVRAALCLPEAHLA